MPINCPYRVNVNNVNRDGLAFNDNQGSNRNYNPNSFRPFKFDKRAESS